VIREWFNRAWRAAFAPRMLYGWRHADGRWLAHTRISSATHIECPQRFDVGDHVYIGAFNLIDASGGLHLGEGCQVTTHCVLLTHSSHRAIRLAGRSYWGASDPPGYVRQATAIGRYCFIGAHAVVAPGSRIGHGALVRAYSYVSGEVPPFAIVAGQPAQVIGDTREVDGEWLERHPECRADYEAWARDRPTDRPTDLSRAP
jgi:acetyltransferase-like isoleucine patch superfamily enzyme